MTVSSTTRKAGPYNGNGVTVSFPFAFKVFSAADVLVVRADATGTETTLTPTTDYTVSLNPDQNVSPGGSVTPAVVLATGLTLTISSALDYLQPVTLTNNGGFYPAVLNTALDRLTIFCQQLAEQVSRAVKVNLSSSTDPAVLVSQLLQRAADSDTNASASAINAANAANSAAAAAAFAATVNLPTSLIGKSLNLLRVKTDETGFELRTPAQARGDLSAAKSGVNTDITSLNAPALGAATSDTPSPGDNSNKVANTAFGATLAPAGQVAHFGFTTAPAGWLKANGALVSRTAYANLFAAIGTTFGAGDGSTTFALPDVRGEFLRGWDDGRGVDSGRTLGSAQADALQNITGTFAQGGLSTTTGAFANSSSFTGVGQGAQTNYMASFDASRVARTAAETRPRNIALLACIKY